MSDEKRRFSRVPFNVKVELTVDHAQYISEEIDNLSVGGCRLSIAADLEVGAPCRLRILLSETTDGPHVQVEGQVVRCESGTVAIQFTGIDPDSLFHLQNIIRYNFPDTDKVEQELSDHPGLV